MKTLREYIQKEIKRLSEAIVKRPLPNDAKKTLFDLLNLAIYTPKIISKYLYNGPSPDKRNFTTYNKCD